MKKYSFDDHPEHRDRLPEYRDRWISHAMSTSAMTDEDRAACTAALEDMYRHAGLAWHGRVVYVPSPFVARFAGGFAAWVWATRTTWITSTWFFGTTSYDFRSIIFVFLIVSEQIVLL